MPNDKTLVACTCCLIIFFIKPKYIQVSDMWVPVVNAKIKLQKKIKRKTWENLNWRCLTLVSNACSNNNNNDTLRRMKLTRNNSRHNRRQTLVSNACSNNNNNDTLRRMKLTKNNSRHNRRQIQSFSLAFSFPRPPFFKAPFRNNSEVFLRCNFIISRTGQ